ncbi:hypothetical protein RhiTH_011567 [Rhizoctonia solani]
MAKGGKPQNNHSKGKEKEKIVKGKTGLSEVNSSSLKAKNNNTPARPIMLSNEAFERVLDMVWNGIVAKELAKEKGKRLRAEIRRGTQLEGLDARGNALDEDSSED